MGVVDKDGALYWATGIDTSGLQRDTDKAKQILGDLNQSAIKEGRQVEQVYRDVLKTIGSKDALYWHAGIDTDKLKIDSGKISQIFTEMEINASTSIAEMQERLSNTMDTQRGIIRALENELHQLESAYAKIATASSGQSTPEIIEQRRKEKEAIAQLRAELKLEKDELETRLQVMDLFDKKTTSITHRISQLRNEISEMRSRGEENTKQYREMVTVLEELTIASRQVRVEQQSMMKGSNFRGVLSAMSGLAGVMTAGAGAMGMLNAESENYAKVQARVQSMIAITIGLQQAYNVLLPTSEFRVVTVTKAKQAWDRATQNLTRSQIVLRGVLTGGLFVAVGLLIGAIDKLVKKQKEQREEAKKLSDLAIKNSNDQMVSYEKLRRSYNLLGNDIKSKEKYILDNQSAFDQLGVSISDVNEADNIFIYNTQAFKNAVSERAKATAAMEMASEKYRDVLAAEDKLDKTPKGYVTKTGTYTDGYGTKRKGKVIEKSRGWKEAEKDVEEAQKEFDKFIEKSVSHTNKAADIMHSAGMTAANTVKEGTKAFYEKVIKDNQFLLDNMNEAEKGSKEWNEIVAKIEEAEKKLDAWKRNRVGGDARKIESQFDKDMLEQLKKLAKEELDLLKQKTDGKLALIEIEKNAAINAINEEEIAAKKLAESEGKSFDSSVFDSRRSVATESFNKQTEDTMKDLFEAQVELYRQLDEVFLNSEEKKREAIKRTYQDMRKEAEKAYNSGDMDESTFRIVLAKINATELEAQKQRLLEAVEDLNKKQADTNKRYDTLILDAQKQLNEAKTEEEKEAAERLISLLEESREKALSTIQSQMLQETDEWRNLFVNLEYLTAEQIEKIVEKIEQGLGNMNLDPADLKAVTDQLERAKDVATDLRNRNPFKGIVNSAQRYKDSLVKLKKAQDDLNEAIKNGADDKTLNKLSVAVGKAKKSVEEAASAMVDNLNDVKEIVDAIGGSLMSVFDSFGMMQDDSSKQMADSIMSIASGALQAGTGIAKMASGDIVGGVIDLAKGLGDVIVGINGVSDASKQKTIEELYKTIERTEKEVKSLTKVYEDLERASSKAFSTAKAEMIAEMKALNQQEIELFKKQNETYRKMIEEEKSKKNSDDSVIKGFEDAIEANLDRIKDLTNAIEDSQDAFIEAMIGASVMREIDQFAQAYADAFTSGNDAAKASADIVKNLLKNALIEAMKNDLAEDVENYMTMLAEAMTDGYISASEQAALDALEQALNEKAEKWQSQFEVEEDKRGGVTGELKKEMTEGTASQLVGLWNMTAMDIRSIKELLFDKMGGNRELLIKNGSDNVSDLIRMMDQVHLNTLRTADNTDNLIPAIRELKSELEEIKRNTKPDGSRG